MKANAKSNIQRRLTINLVTIIILAICLCITTYALVSSIWVRNNTFDTGKVDITLTGEYSDTDKIIKESEFLFEPGMTVIKPAYVTNNSTDPVYCKLYFKDIDGELADILEITIRDGNTVLYKGKASALTGADAEHSALDKTIIGMGDNNKKEYTVVFHYPEDAGNAGQNQYLEFTMVAEAVQTKNNPAAEF